MTKSPHRVRIAPLHPDAHSDEGAVRTSLPWRALESLGGAVILVDASLRVVGATRSAARTLGAPVPIGAHVVRILSGGNDPRIADAFSGERAVVATIPSGRAGNEVRTRVRATPLRDGAEHVGWIVRLVEEPSRSGAAQHFESMWACGESMKRVFAMAELIAECDASVLLSGEMGVGKATLAAAIHARSARRAHGLRTLTCAAMTPEILEHQLIAPTPSDAASTLLLDEITELPHETQGYLLRVLESGFVTPIEGGAAVPIDVRTIATTSKSLDKEVEAGRLRADLLVRLRTLAIEIPPLRARPMDVPLLAEKFVAELAAQGARSVTGIADDALARLVRHTWPGNVRELRVVVESALATGRGPTLALADLPASIAEPGGAPRELAPETPHDTAPPSDEGARIRRALERAGGDRTRAAAMLGMSRSTLWRRMRSYGLAPGRGGP
jgi:DNA-binding NtrC family response regulator